MKNLVTAVVLSALAAWSCSADPAASSPTPMRGIDGGAGAGAVSGNDDFGNAGVRGGGNGADAAGEAGSDANVSAPASRLDGLPDGYGWASLRGSGGSPVSLHREFVGPADGVDGATVDCAYIVDGASRRLAISVGDGPIDVFAATVNVDEAAPFTLETNSGTDAENGIEATCTVDFGNGVQYQYGPGQVADTGSAEFDFSELLFLVSDFSLTHIAGRVACSNLPDVRSSAAIPPEGLGTGAADLQFECRIHVVE